MKVGENKVVSMTYTLKESDSNGPVIQKVTSERPFVYLFGMGGLLPAFKANLEGLGKDASFGFTLKKEDAYGVRMQENIIDLDKKVFEIDGVFDDNMVRVGEIVPMEDEDGYPISGKILAVEENSVKVDFNHPLAGMDLYFEGTILDIREATSDEINHGHAHGPQGHSHG